MKKFIIFIMLMIAQSVCYAQSHPKVDSLFSYLKEIGMVKACDLIMNPIKQAYDQHVMKIFRGKAQFLVSGLDGASAAVLGASAIGWEI